MELVRCICCCKYVLRFEMFEVLDYTKQREMVNEMNELQF